MRPCEMGSKPGAYRLPAERERWGAATHKTSVSPIAVANPPIQAWTPFLIPGEASIRRRSRRRTAHATHWWRPRCRFGRPGRSKGRTYRPRAATSRIRSRCMRRTLRRPHRPDCRWRGSGCATCRRARSAPAASPSRRPVSPKFLPTSAGAGRRLDRALAAAPARRATGATERRAVRHARSARRRVGRAHDSAGTAGCGAHRRTRSAGLGAGTVPGPARHARGANPCRGAQAARTIARIARRISTTFCAERPKK